MSTLTIAITTSVVSLLVVAGLAVVREIRRLRRALDRAWWASRHDPLTGLPNRVLAEQLFTQRAQRGFPMVVALLDLDRFKQVNDRYGHHTGDQLLTAVAGRLTHAAADHGGQVARLSGDEFVLLLPPHPAGLFDPVVEILRNLAAAIPLPAEEQGGDPVTLTVTATAGASWFDGRHGSWSSLLREADLALYHARARGSRCERYRPGMRMPQRPHRHRRRLRDQHREASA